jgi:hypothetical protein
MEMQGYGRNGSLYGRQPLLETKHLPAVRVPIPILIFPGFID